MRYVFKFETGEMKTMAELKDAKRIAIVTGASGGIGFWFVKLLLNEKVDEIWAIGRSYLRLSALSDKFGEKIKPFPMNLALDEALSDFARKLKRRKVNIVYLVNCAGVAKFGAYDTIGCEDVNNMIDLNMSAIVKLTNICLPYMCKGSHIINMGSQAGFQPLPYLNIYAATKAFVCNYSRALNVELEDRGIVVTVVCPGWVKTEFLEKSKSKSKKTVTYFPYITTADIVAKKALRDAHRGKDISVCGWHIKMDHFLSRILPAKTAMRLWLRQQRIC